MGYSLGILGGMGPLATSTLYQRIISKTKVSCDQEHIEMVVLNKCSIPDRTKALLDNGENPIPKINEGINELISLGCRYFIIPCNTAHCFKKSFNNLDKITFIDMISETQKLLKGLEKKILVLCTDGTKKLDIYGNGLNVFYPESYFQAIIMNIITKTKAGEDAYFLLKKVILDFNNSPLLLACTELSIYYERLKKDSDLSNVVIYDALEILAQRAIEECQKNKEK